MPTLEGRWVVTGAEAGGEPFDFLHADGARWAAIHVIDGNRLHLAYVVDDGVTPRPRDFSTASNMLTTRIDLERRDQ